MCSCVFLLHQDHVEGFLGGKLTVFKFYNYRFVWAKISQVIFEIVSAYFVVYELILLLVNFCTTIRAVNI
jgi:hypothetical protein